MTDVEALYPSVPVLSQESSMAAERLRLSAVRFHEALLHVCPDGPEVEAAGANIRSALDFAFAALATRDEALSPPEPELGRVIPGALPQSEPSQGSRVTACRIDEATARAMRDGKAPLPGSPII